MTEKSSRWQLPHSQYPHEFLTTLPDTICESAARLLFMNVKWMKTVTAINLLPMKDQVGEALLLFFSVFLAFLARAGAFRCQGLRRQTRASGSPAHARDIGSAGLDYICED